MQAPKADPPRYRKLLLPCPFCGSPPEMVKWHGGSKRKRLVSCVDDSCPSSPAASGETPVSAAKAWNTRSPR